MKKTGSCKSLLLVAGLLILLSARPGTNDALLVRWCGKVGVDDVRKAEYVLWVDGKLAEKSGGKTADTSRDVGAITRLLTALAVGRSAQDGNLVVDEHIRRLIEEGDPQNELPRLVAKAEEQPMCAYLSRTVLARLDTIYEWAAKRDTNSCEMDGSDGSKLWLTSLVKIGECLRNEGRWRKSRPLSAEACLLAPRKTEPDGAYWFDGGNGVILAVMPKEAAALALAAPGAGIPQPAPKAKEPPSLGETRAIFNTHVPKDGSRRNSEGDIVKLRDGRLMLVWSRFLGSGGDSGHADIVKVYSSDGGKTWTKPEVLLAKPEGALNVMCASLLRLRDGDLAFGCLEKMSEKDCRLVFMRSSDEGTTWTKPVKTIDKVGYYVVNNGRLVQLSTGRLIFAWALHSDWNRFPGGGLGACFSDDGGRTWRMSSTALDTRTARRVVIRTEEPGVVELKDGRLMMFARTDRGSQYVSYSSDGGDTWSAAEPSSLISPRSPAAVTRLSTGELAALWNDHEGHPEYVLEGPYGNGPRYPLVFACSSDEGKTWGGRVSVETAKDCFSYPVIREFDGTLYFVYSVGGGLRDLRVVSLPLLDVAIHRGVIQ